MKCSRQGRASEAMGQHPQHPKAREDLQKCCQPLVCPVTLTGELPPTHQDNRDTVTPCPLLLELSPNPSELFPAHPNLPEGSEPGASSRTSADGAGAATGKGREGL